MLNKKTLMIIEGITLILWIITLIIFLVQVNNNSVKCLANPLVYGVKTLSEQNNASMTCLCKYDNAIAYTIFVDKNRWSLNYTGSYSFSGSQLDLTKINLTKVK